MYYVYVLWSLKDKNLYTGFSSVLGNRIRDHRIGKVAVTKNRRPLVLVYYEACLNQKDAINREIYLKSAWGKRYIKNRLSEYFRKVPVR